MKAAREHECQANIPSVANDVDRATDEAQIELRGRRLPLRFSRLNKTFALEESTMNRYPRPPGTTMVSSTGDRRGTFNASRCMHSKSRDVRCQIDVPERRYST